MKVIDHCETWTPGLGAKMKAAGITHVGRYQGIGGEWKQLIPAEAKDYRANGIGIFTIMEGSTNRVKDGFAAGAADAKVTLADMNACGAPDGAFVWAGCDYEAPASDCPAIIEYLKGAETVFGKGRVGLYGGRVACEYALAHGYRIWQTHAWSGSPVTYWIPGADMYQRNDWGYTYYGKFLPDYDTNEIQKPDFGQWGATPVVVPPTPEVPTVATAQDVLKYAAKEIGTVESPANSNRVKYNAWAGLQGQPWCDTFVCWCFNQAGVMSLVGGRYAYTPSHASWFKARKQWGTTAKVGAVVFFDFPDSVDRIQHVGIVEKVNSGSITTIEGNTSSGNSGSQSNGGGVFRRTRSGSSIVGYGYPKYGVIVAPLPPHKPVVDAGPGAIYRLFNGKHFFTASVAEANAVQDMGYTYEGAAWFADPADNTVPVKRFFKGTAHIWTVDATEQAALVKSGWKDEGTAFYAAAEGVPVCRFRSPAGNYFYSLDQTEGTKAGYAYEGVAWRIQQGGTT